MSWAFAALLVAGCNSATGPEGPTVLVVAGDGQTSLVGWQLEQSVIIEVRDGGSPMPGAVLQINAMNGGRASPGRATTDESGQVTVTWTLGANEPGTQRLELAIAGQLLGEATAMALSEDQGDAVIVRGARGPLVGVAMIRQTQFVQLIGGNAVSDTIFAIPPRDASDVDLVLFGTANRPLLAQPIWTPGVDTVEVTMLPSVVVDLDIDVRVGDFATQQDVMNTQIATTARIFSEEGMGIEIGNVTYTDNTTPGVDDDRASNTLCSGRSPGGPTVTVTMITSIDDGQYVGWGCWSGHIFMAERTGQVPNLLAHELGHTFTLIHTPDGMMRARGPQTKVREGETFRAHFHSRSTLNRSYASQPVNMRRDCGTPTACIPETLDLQALAAGTSPTLLVSEPRVTTFLTPVDDVRPPPER